MRLHSGSFSADVDRRILKLIRQDSAHERQGRRTGLSELYEQSIAGAVTTFRAGANPNRHRLIASRILVVKAARPNERGVIVVDYTYVFPLLAGLFDLAAIAERYTIVLEPSWAGSCSPEVLLFSRLSQPVYVETIEPRDRALLETHGTNLRTVPIAANWWVDPRPETGPQAQAGKERDIDVIMVAAWADIKRAFRTLAQLRARGHRLKIALVGYRYDRTKEDIEALAAHFGVRDSIETYERISQDEVSALLRRSKVHLLWWRRECANRAIVEAMLADTPVIVRDGMTFGFKYPYINEQTGRFVREGDLAAALLQMIADRGQFFPRAWVLEHMTCHKATAVLESHLREAALAAGEPWTEGLAVKTSTLDTQRYFDPADRERFRADYRFLESIIRDGARAVDVA
jgi:glycosyltransferase involved in cell wall biosynthesis